MVRAVDIQRTLYVHVHVQLYSTREREEGTIPSERLLSYEEGTEVKLSDSGKNLITTY